MEKEEIGFLEERPGVKSSTRLYSLLLLIFLFIFDIGLVISNDGCLDYNFVFFNFVGLLGVFAPKALHKIAEMKLDKLSDGKNK